MPRHTPSCREQVDLPINQRVSVVVTLGVNTRRFARWCEVIAAGHRRGVDLECDGHARQAFAEAISPLHGRRDIHQHISAATYQAQLNVVVKR